jgi:hypothetical protein
MWAVIIIIGTYSRPKHIFFIWAGSVCGLMDQGSNRQLVSSHPQLPLDRPNWLTIGLFQAAVTIKNDKHKDSVELWKGLSCWNRQWKSRTWDNVRTYIEHKQFCFVLFF